MLNLLPRKLATLTNIDYSPRIRYVDVMAEFAMVPNLALPYSSAHWMWAASQSNACSGTEAVVYFSNHIGKHFLTCQGYRLDTINQATRTESMKRVDKNKEIIQSLLS
jgi:hypothetical protein